MHFTDMPGLKSDLWLAYYFKVLCDFKSLLEPLWLEDIRQVLIGLENFLQYLYR